MELIFYICIQQLKHKIMAKNKDKNKKKLTVEEELALVKKELKTTKKELKLAIRGYFILEEYVCNLVGGSEVEDNQTLTYTNSLIAKIR